MEIGVIMLIAILVVFIFVGYKMLHTSKKDKNPTYTPSDGAGGGGRGEEIIGDMKEANDYPSFIYKQDTDGAKITSEQEKK